MSRLLFAHTGADTNFIRETGSSYALFVECLLAGPQIPEVESQLRRNENSQTCFLGGRSSFVFFSFSFCLQFMLVTFSKIYFKKRSLLLKIPYYDNLKKKKQKKEKEDRKMKFGQSLEKILELFFVIFWSRMDAPGLSSKAKERGYSRARQKRRRKSRRLGNEQQTEVGRFDKRWKRGDEEGELPLNMLIPST